MSKEGNKVDEIINRLDQALKAFGQGRVYVVGTMVLYRGKLGVIVDLNKDSSDPTGSTVDIRMEDGTVHEKVKVNSKSLVKYRS